MQKIILPLLISFCIIAFNLNILAFAQSNGVNKQDNVSKALEAARRAAATNIRENDPLAKALSEARQKQATNKAEDDKIAEEAVRKVVGAYCRQIKGGHSAENDKSNELCIYSQIAKNIISRNFRFISPTLSGDSISAISIHVDGSGNIVNYNLNKSSGQVLLDNAAIRAVTETKKLPPPPAGIDYIQVSFSSH